MGTYTREMRLLYWTGENHAPDVVVRGKHKTRYDAGVLQRIPYTLCVVYVVVICQ